MAGQQVRHAKLWFAGENENNVVKRPTAPPFTNQEFGVVKPQA